MRRRRNEPDDPFYPDSPEDKRKTDRQFLLDRLITLLIAVIAAFAGISAITIIVVINNNNVRPVDAEPPTEIVDSDTPVPTPLDGTGPTVAVTDEATPPPDEGHPTSTPGDVEFETNTPEPTPCTLRADWTGRHTVQEGENLSMIADLYRVNVYDLADANCIRDAMDLIVPGQQLRVPARTVVPTAPPSNPTQSPGDVGNPGPDPIDPDPDPNPGDPTIVIPPPEPGDPTVTPPPGGPIIGDPRLQCPAGTLAIYLGEGEISRSSHSGLPSTVTFNLALMQGYRGGELIGYSIMGHPDRCQPDSDDESCIEQQQPNESFKVFVNGAQVHYQADTGDHVISTTFRVPLMDLGPGNHSVNIVHSEEGSGPGSVGFKLGFCALPG